MSNVADVAGKVFITKVELAKRWRVKTRTIELWVRKGTCPAPSKPSYKVARWDLNDILDHEIRIKEGCSKPA